MANTRYYEIERSDPNFKDICLIAINKNCLPSLGGNFAIIKLNNKDLNDYDFLKKYTKLKKGEALELRRSPKYQEELLA